MRRRRGGRLLLSARTAGRRRAGETRCCPSGLDAGLQCAQQTAEHIVIGDFLAEQQSLDGVIVRQQSDHILQQETLAVFQQFDGIVHLQNVEQSGTFIVDACLCAACRRCRSPAHLGVNVHRDHVVDVDHMRTTRFRVPQQSVQLEETGSGHQFEHIAGDHFQFVTAATVQKLHDQLHGRFESRQLEKICTISGTIQRLYLTWKM